MRKIFLKLFLATFPILFVLAVYAIKDPFKMLYHYDSYYAKDGVPYVVLNKDYVSTRTFVNNYPKYKYDAFIFGNSRSMYYHVAEWEKHIGPARCFHFDASGETLYGIERKFQFLYDRGVPIKNALIVFDQPSCMVTKNTGEAHLFKKDPLLTGQKEFDFQIECLKAFFDVHFLKVYLSFLVNHKMSEGSVEKFFLDNVPIHYEQAINEVSYPVFEADIARNRDSFYLARASAFYKRDTTVQQYAIQTLGYEQKKEFYNIKRILDENHANYRFVISPMYGQVKMDTTDLQILYGIFGKKNVYDFSGINDITNNKYNYYENSHYRPFIANRIMDSIYKDNGSK